MIQKLSTDSPVQNLSDDTLIKVYEESRSPLIITDYRRDDNPIIYSNQAFLDLTGYAMNEIIGRNCRFLQGDDTDKNTISMLRDAVRTGVYVRVTIKNYRKDGTPFWNDLVMSPIKDDRGEVRYFSGMQLDVTERVLAEERLRAKTRELEQANRELEQFTYASSHDLQEPLRMISSYLQLIGKRYGDVLDDSGKVFLNYATEGAERMQELIYDLLTLSRVSTTNDKFRPTELKRAVDQACLNLKLTIEETGSTVSASRLPKLRVDPVQMTQLFQNLIGNAIKYRDPERQMHVRVSVRRVDAEYVISVADNGIGIDKQYFDRIFVIFQRLHTRTEYSGNGVGLAICARIVERHGGRIWVESTVGKGTTFKFSLPAEQED